MTDVDMPLEVLIDQIEIELDELIVIDDELKLKEDIEGYYV